MPATIRTTERAAAFCAALAECCNVGRACKASGMSRNAAYDWRDDDPAFAAAWDRAMKRGIVALEDEMHRRAFEGVEDPLTHQGQFTYLYERDAQGEIIYDEYVASTSEAGEQIKAKRPRLMLDEQGNPRIATVRKYSDTLAIFLAKAHDPEKYRERTEMQVKGSVDVAATIYEARKRVKARRAQAEPNPEDFL